MQTTKETYLSPESELLLVRFEKGILSEPWKNASVQELDEDELDQIF